MRDREELWQTGRDEPVEVNQRALIDKVLARYSGEFTLFRELLQNSDDARSRAAEIRFETAAYLGRDERNENGLDAPPLGDLKSTVVAQWTFRNDGKAFTDQDWKRLPRIAEGNPSPEKIGAFGVGFYSLFSVTERPFVSSGGHGMQFYWKDDKDKLYVRRGDLPSRGISNPWTTFEMPLREAGPIPPALEFMQFLASSITFMVNLREVGVFVDEHCIGRIKKFPGNVQAIGITEGLRCSSPLNIMNVGEVQRCPITIKAEVMHAIYATGTWKMPPQDVSEPRNKGEFFSSGQSLPSQGAPTSPKQAIDPMQIYQTTVDLTVFTAEVNVKLDEKLAAELLRTTKKLPPSRLTYGLIYTGKDEYDRSLKYQSPEICDSIFQGLRADLDGATHTRIFIGHATGQTTGIGGHMASYFIPTVERESIDLNDRKISIWNKELLYVGGFLSRAVYELELAEIQDTWEGVAGLDGTLDSRQPAKLRDSLHQRFLHILKFFTFHRSTPSEKVARLLEDAFYRCSVQPLRFLSSTGVRLAPDIKQCDAACARFLKYLPMLRQDVMQECPRVVEALPDEHKISRIIFQDVLEDLRKHALTQEELVACLQWWTSMRGSAPDTTRLLAAITLRSANGTDLQLSSVQYFIGPESNKARIPLDGPLPASLLPHDITRTFNTTDLVAFNWKEFTIIDWLQHISQSDIMSSNPKHDFTRSLEWAERVLSILSGVWSLSSETLYRLASTTFKGRNCIPTTHGLRPPEESFLSSTANNSLFQALDLPVIRLENKGDMEGLLLYIGVRKYIPPEVLFQKMVGTGNWSVSDLISYLVQVQNNLNTDEFSRLKSFEGFTQEGVQGDIAQRRRYRAVDLYPPLDVFRQLRLPIIDWGEKTRWRNESEPADLLYRLGLCRYPPLETIIDLCASTLTDARVREIAFNYLCDNLRSKYSQYNPENFRHIAFVPAEKEDGPCLAKLGEVFLNTSWKTLGFSVVRDNYRRALVTELGIQQHPPTPTLLQLLENTPPTTGEKARRWFESLFECITSFSQQDLSRLSELPIVPTGPSNGWRQLPPTQCYLGEGAKDEFHTRLFVFVDFGSTANRFLRACGSKNEPSVKDIAESLIEDPDRFYRLAEAHQGFLEELRDLATRNRRIPNMTLSKMMSKPILLGVRLKKTTEGGEREYERELRVPGGIVIADDNNTYRLFEKKIFAAPQEAGPGLEAFYETLGCRKLSTIVQEQYKMSNEIKDARISAHIQSLVLERLPLFLREVTHTKIQIPNSWLSSENFHVRVCKELIVSKTLTLGDIQETQKEDVWAATKCDEGKGQVELWLSQPGNQAEPDKYEIATCLCRLLFGTAKLNDTLLLTTILSTPLGILKRRGYNVDIIHKSDEQQPEGLEKERSDFCHTPVTTTTSRTTNLVPEQSVTTTEYGTLVAGSESSTTRLVPAEPGTAMGNTLSTSPLHHPTDSAPNDIRSPFQKLTSRLIPGGRSSVTIRSAPQTQYSWTPREVMPQSYIRAHVRKAKVCSPEGGKLLHHRNKMEEIRQFPNEGYCDISGHGKLKCCKKTHRDVKLYTTEDVDNPDMFMTTLQDKLARFLNVLIPVAEIFDLSPTLLHVFYDANGGPIAFNRNRSIFLNLRYFEAWHDQDVQKGNEQQARILWFLALAHELAHNLIKQHNSEHEFWFSAICEDHIPTFSARLLGH